MTRLHFTQKSSMSSPSLTVRVNIYPPESRLRNFRFRRRGDRSHVRRCRGVRNGFFLYKHFLDRLLLNQPARLVEADVLADPQLTLFEFEKIAHHQRRFGVAEQGPGGVLVIRLHFTGRLVILRLHTRGARNMWRPAKLLSGIVLHSVNAESRHESPIVVDMGDVNKVQTYARPECGHGTP